MRKRLAGAIVFEVSGTLALRASLDNSLWVIVVAIGYVVSFGFLAAVLREGAPIGVTYGIWVPAASRSPRSSPISCSTIRSPG